MNFFVTGCRHHISLTAKASAVCALLLGAGLAIAPHANAMEPRPDPREIVGKEVHQTQYPDNWKGIGNPFYSGANSLEGDTIFKGKTHAFVLLKIATPVSAIPRVSVVIDAVRIGVDTRKVGQLFIKDCRHPNLHLSDDQVVFAEVRFKRCERYSSRISKAWLIDINTQKIRPVSPKGMRCEDTFFNNGEGIKCPPVETE